MSAHTPGPWFADGRLVVESNKDAVAMVNLARHVDVAHADARLMAAAPDLLAALEQAADVIESHLNGSRDPMIRDLMDARAAIAKAEGRK